MLLALIGEGLHGIVIHLCVGFRALLARTWHAFCYVIGLFFGFVLGITISVSVVIALFEVWWPAIQILAKLFTLALKILLALL